MITLGGKTALQRLRTAAGMGPPITTFAALPSVGSVPGQLRQLSDVNNIIVQARDVWRPYGGRQVLAMRMTNPVTVQSLSQMVAETIGPFPGGLVRTGMKVRLEIKVGHSGISTSPRYCTARIGTGAVRNNFGEGVSQISNADSNSILSVSVDVLSDSNAAHLGDLKTYAGFNAAKYTPTVDFSAAWSADISMISVAETAVNIASATWAAGVATFNTSAPSTLVTGDKTVIAGVSPSGWNIAAGAIVTRIDDDTFTVPMAADPGAYVSGGTSSRVSNMKSESYILTLEG